MKPLHYSSDDMWWGTLGTIRPFSNFRPDQDAMEIQAALDGKDAGTLVNLLTNRNNAQRQVIAVEYKKMTNKDLNACLKKALSGDLENLLLQLLMLPEHFDAQRLQDAMAGLGTDEETLMEILSTRSKEQLQQINNAFQQWFKKDLEKELRGETSGDFAKLVVALLKKGDSPAVVQRDVEALAASLDGKKANAVPWIEILTSRSSAHLENGEYLAHGACCSRSRADGLFLDSADGTGAAARTGAGADVGQRFQRRLSDGFEGFSSMHPEPGGLPGQEAEHHEDITGTRDHGVSQ
uniref:Annexin n=1 Tax=Oryzias sinensis TaxID=183150 RepID=A0A8C7Z2H9_9TELE